MRNEKKKKSRSWAGVCEKSPSMAAEGHIHRGTNDGVADFMAGDYGRGETRTSIRLPKMGDGVGKGKEKLLGKKNYVLLRRNAGAGWPRKGNDARWCKGEKENVKNASCRRKKKRNRSWH